MIEPMALDTAPAAPRKLRRAADLPGPRGVPLLGNSLQIDPPALPPAARSQVPRARPVLPAEDRPAPLRRDRRPRSGGGVLRDRPEGCRRTQRLEQVWAERGMPPGVFGAHGEVWRRQRRMVMAGFDPVPVKSYFPAMQKVAQRLGTRWQAAAQQNQAIDLQADLMRFTVDTIAGPAFGAEVNTPGSDGDVIQQHLDKIFPMLFRRILAAMPAWRYVRSAADREWRHPEALARATEEVPRAVADPAAPTMDQMAQLDCTEACAHGTMCPAPPPSSPSAGWSPAGRVHGPVRPDAMPFGAGPRMCPGRYLALLEMKMAMATLPGRFDNTAVDTPDGEEAKEQLAFTMTPVGLTMTLRPRAT